MEVCRKSSWLLTLLGVIFLAGALQGVQGEVEIDGPSETQCRPYIEKALRELEHVGAEDTDVGQSQEEAPTIDNSLDDEQRSTETTENENDTQDFKEEEDVSTQVENQEETEAKTEDVSESGETENKEENDTQEEEAASRSESSETLGGKLEEDAPEAASTEKGPEDSLEDTTNEEPDNNEGTSAGASVETVEDTASEEEVKKDDPPNLSADDASTETEQLNEDIESSEDVEAPQRSSREEIEASTESPVEGTEENQHKEEASIETAMNNETTEDESEESRVQSEEKDNDEENKSASALAAGSDEDNKSENDDNEDDTSGANEHQDSSARPDTSDENDLKEDSDDTVNTDQDDSREGNKNSEQSQETEDEVEKRKRSVDNSEEHESEIQIDNHDVKEPKDDDSSVTDNESVETNEKSTEDENDETKRSAENDEDNESRAESANLESSIANENSQESNEHASKEEINTNDPQDNEKSEEKQESKQEEQAESNEKSENGSNTAEDSNEDAPEEDLAIEVDVPSNLRPREYVEQLLKIDREATKTEEIVDRISEITLRELKRLYENAIKPLETLYKYRDLSNRHYGDAEIFSKPLILFMGPWSGGKSTIINYLLNIEYNDTALRTGAEPSPAYFNLLMHGEEEEILDGTQLAADYTFSGLQKFGQGLEERLRGIKLPSKLLEKVNIAEIPGILEVRKQVSRVFPFNDACQWFIDRADIIFLVYDPTKLDVGPETEAILDQLKGREYQTRIVLNKADQVKPEELMRVQGALIWNISPLMSSPQPPVMYTTSLWSRPYEQWAPIRLLQSQERAFLRDLRSAVDKRIENKIASARRFAVRVRNHAKMVDCYLTTYYNHKSIFGNKKQVADAIIEHPQDYHIYEGLSTLTNISRYDLPDPDVYKDFFRLNPLYEFQQLSATCTYFRGCPINKLDVAIAYDFPELVGKHKRLVEAALAESNQDHQAQGS
ncbi:hypothetical protein WA026_010340 [Henosepilachna vigintioctopunctata]|uniref:Dynamin-type G domain-containing protein n=1 Tax=Henosepilachna vigintioctopunctata TaxID=420089 RepID=A0AAW1VBY4_9CUCU